MGDEPLLAPGQSAGTMSMYGLMSGLQRKPSTAFALQHGLKYHYDELAALYRELNISPAMRVENDPQAFTSRMQKKYGLKTAINPQPQYGGYQFRGPLIGVPNSYGSKHYLIADPPVQDAIVEHVQKETRYTLTALTALASARNDYIFFQTYNN